MAPEQIRGEPADQRTDIYAVGVLMYQLATGQLPFQGASSIEVEEMHLHAPSPRPSDVAAVPLELDQVVGRCLQKRPEDRFQRVDDLLADLRRAVAKRGGVDQAQSRVLGLFVQATVAPDAETLDGLSSGLLDAQHSCESSGLSICFEAENAFLAAVALPSGEPDDQALRAKVLRMAAESFADLRARFPEVQFSFSAHAAAAQIHLAAGKLELTGGELLSLTRWVSDREGVSATAPAAAKLGGDMALGPIAGRPDLFGVRLVP